MGILQPECLTPAQVARKRQSGRGAVQLARPEEFSGKGQVTGAAAMDSLDLVTQRHIMHVLDECDGNRAEAARRLGVSRKTIDRKCAGWGV